MAKNIFQTMHKWITSAFEEGHEPAVVLEIIRRATQHGNEAGGLWFCVACSRVCAAASIVGKHRQLAGVPLLDSDSIMCSSCYRIGQKALKKMDCVPEAERRLAAMILRARNPAKRAKWWMRIHGTNGP